MEETKFKNYFEKTERLSTFHKFVLLCLFVTALPQGAVNFSPVFVFHTSNHRCTIPVVDRNHDDATFNFTVLRQYIPIHHKNSELAKCSRFINDEVIASSSISNQSIEFDDGLTEPCIDGWEYENTDGKKTAVEEFDLVCENEWQRPLLTFGYSIGALVSGIIAGAISDRFGRRKATLGSVTVLMSVIFGYSFATNYWMCFAGFTAYGLGASVTYSMVFVHAQELVKTDHRDVASCLINICMSTGYMLMPVIAYLCTNWRWIIRIPGFFCILFMSYYCFLPESPHWLFSKGKHKEAIRVLTRLIPNSKTEETFESLTHANSIINNDESPIISEKSIKPTRISFGKSLVMLFRNRVMLKRTLVLCWMWIVSFVVYFTFGYNTSNLGGNYYLNSFLSAAAEVPGWILALYLLKKIGRRFSLAGAFALSSICCLLCPLFGSYHSVSVTFAMIGKVFSSSNMGMVYLYTAELLPTTLRSTGVGIASSSARIACLFAPFLAFSGETSGKWIPFYVMSGLSMLAAFLTLFLPETKNIPLPENMSEALALERFRLKVSIFRSTVSNTRANVSSKNLLDDDLQEKTLITTR